MGEFVGVDPVSLQELANRLRRLHTLLAEHGPMIQQKMQKWDSELSFAALPRLVDEALNDTRDMGARTAKAYELAREKGWGPSPADPDGPLVPLATATPPDTTGTPADPTGKPPGTTGTPPDPATTLADPTGTPPDTTTPADPTGTDSAATPTGPDGAPPHTAESPPTVRLDWAATGQSGNEAGLDAKAMAEALATGDPDQARDAMSRLPDNLSQHLKDKDYLTAFWTASCPLALQAARALYNRAGATLFSAESASILRALGASLAAATQMRLGTGKDRRPLLPEATRTAIMKNGDPWSVGMLFKYGPDGKTWDSQFLAEVTRSMLDARAAGKIEVPSPSFGGYDPLEAESRRFGGPQAQADFDPVVAVLDRASQNGQAARHVLGDPSSGFTYAGMVVDDQWHTTPPEAGPGPEDPADRTGPIPHTATAPTSLIATAVSPHAAINLSSHAADFVKAAVSAGRGPSDDARESAWAVVTVVQATAEFSRLHPGTDLPAPLREALAFTADRYRTDLAAPAPGETGNEARLNGDPPEGRWTAHADGADLAAFLRQARPRAE
ncbi:hypothetical protein [Sphaerisporangium corydalis]|uniref:Uncharacterized protein n=1 Tax=Sphaerisporangium corydalis TaxID=1441875 RepID=A0ABV9EJT9_9ACTN|nr:hypothetical protein [Sphaerisporangium corydalis]